MNKQINDHEVFWLARYAHNTLAPLLKEAREYEPSMDFTIQMAFCNEDSPFHKYSHIVVSSHWKRDGMFHLSTTLTDKGGVDHVASNVRDFIAKEQQEAEELAEAERQDMADITAHENKAYADYLKDINTQNIAGGN